MSESTYLFNSVSVSRLVSVSVHDLLPKRARSVCPTGNYYSLCDCFKDLAIKILLYSASLLVSVPYFLTSKNVESDSPYKNTD